MFISSSTRAHRSVSRVLSFASRLRRAVMKQAEVPSLLREKLQHSSGCDITDMSGLFEASQANTVRERRGDQQRTGPTRYREMQQSLTNK